MISRATTGVIVFILSLELRLCQGNCPLPQDGKCSRDDYTIDSNKTNDVSAGNCDFTQSTDLCCYQQGCADPNMSNWTLQGGTAQSHQIKGGNCSRDDYYSVLESPWLNNIPEVACFKFTYKRERPAALDVFLETRGGQIKPVLNRTHNSAENQTTDVQWNVTDATVKVIFRAYGGGCCQPIHISKVSVSVGWCTLSDRFVTNDSTDVKRVTSLLLSPTEPGTVDCLQFTYQLPNSAGSRLTVSVQPLGDNTTVTVWKGAVSSGQNLTGQCPLQVHAPYKIIFEEDTSGSSSGFSVKVTQFRRSIRAEDCPLSPTGANTTYSNTVVTSCIASQLSSEGQCQHSSHPNTTCPVISTSTTASSSPQRTTGVPSDTASQSTASETPEKASEDQKESDVAAIGGGVAAAVIVIIIAVVIIVTVVRRRRRLNRDGDKGTTMAVGTE